MKDRLVKFLQSESLTASKFADEIGVQRSSVSHILSGRNNPSYEFIIKTLHRFPKLNAEWLLMGSGDMYKGITQGELFTETGQESNISIQNHDEEKISGSQKVISETTILSSENSMDSTSLSKEISGKAKVTRVILLYDDHSFSFYSTPDVNKVE